MKDYLYIYKYHQNNFDIEEESNYIWTHKKADLSVKYILCVYQGNGLGVFFTKGKWSIENYSSQTPYARGIASVHNCTIMSRICPLQRLGW